MVFLGWFLLIIGVVALLNVLGVITLTGNIFWPLILIFIGLAVLMKAGKGERWSRMWHHAAHAHWEEKQREKDKEGAPTDEKKDVK